VTRRRGRGASASLHCALAPRWWAQRAAAELRRYAFRAAQLRSQLPTPDGAAYAS